MLSDAKPKFKPAPPKFSKELAENSQDDPEPAFLRQYILGDRALENRRKGELLRAAGLGVCLVAIFLQLPATLFPVVASLLLGVSAVLTIALLGSSFWFLWDAKLSDIESRALVQQGEAKIRVLSDAEVEEREQAKQKGFEMTRKAKNGASAIP